MVQRNVSCIRLLSILLVLTTYCFAEKVPNLREHSGPKINISGKSDVIEPQHHLEGEPNNLSNPLQWVEMSPEQEREFYLYLRGVESASLPVDKSNPGVQKLEDKVQKWINRIHQSMNGASPVPKVVIIPDSSPNAWVTGMAVCLKAKLEIEQAPGSPPGKSIEMANFVPGSNIIEMEHLLPVFGGNSNQKLCMDSPKKIELEPFVEYYNAISKNCKLTVKGTDTLVAKGKGCLLPGQNIGSAKTTAFIAVPNRVMVTTGLLKMFANEISKEAPPDARLASVIAHELGHYERAHPVHRSKYDFFYPQTVKPEAKRPVAVDDSDKLVARMKPLLEGPVPIVIDGQKHSAQVVQFLINDLAQGFLPEFCSAKPGEQDWKDCDPVCVRAHEAALGFDRNQLSSGNLPLDAHPSYLKFEKTMNACLRTVRLDRTKESDDKKQAKGQLETVTKTTFPWLKDLKLQKSLNDYVNEIDKQNNTQAKLAKEFFDELKQRNLGWYTAEQEADEISLEHMTNIGISPKAAIAAEFDFGREKQKNISPASWKRFHGVSMEELKELMDNHWIDKKSGNYLFVPIGNFADPHHGTPYRIFDMDREMTAHNYLSRLKPVEYPEYKENWEEIKEISEQLENVPVPQFSWKPIENIKSNKKGRLK